MDNTGIYIRNMVCDRCIKAVSETFARLGIAIAHVELGYVEPVEPIPEDKKNVLSAALREQGFEWLPDKDEQTVERIKIAVVEYIHHVPSGDKKPKLSEYLVKRIGGDYGSLSKLFSKRQGMSVERYAILQKIEKIKELLSYNEHNISEIAHMLGYSSVQHLSAQFKKMTGMTPTGYKKNGGKRRFLDSIGQQKAAR